MRPYTGQNEGHSQKIEVVEWPGGEPTRLEVEVNPAVLAALARGRSSVPLGDDLPPAALGGLPWGSIVATRSGGREARLVAGPARHHAGEWQLPVFEAFASPETADAEVEARARALRRGFGLEGRLSLA